MIISFLLADSNKKLCLTINVIKPNEIMKFKTITYILLPAFIWLLGEGAFREFAEIIIGKF